MGLEMLMNMFGGLGAGSLAVPNRSDGCYSHPHLSFTNLCFHLTDFIFFRLQCLQSNYMPPSCHNFKKWVSLIHKKIYGL